MPITTATDGFVRPVARDAVRWVDRVGPAFDMIEEELRATAREPQAADPRDVLEAEP